MSFVQHILPSLGDAVLRGHYAKPEGTSGS